MCRAQKGLEKPGRGGEFRGPGMNTSCPDGREGKVGVRSNSAAGSGGLRGPSCAVSVLEEKEARVAPSAAGAASLPAALGSSGLVGSTPAARFPFGAVLPLRGRLRGAELLLPPLLSLEDRRPGPVPRDSSQGPQGPAGPSPSGREAASQPRAQRCPARHTDPSSGLPAGVSPLKPLPPSALLPPGPAGPALGLRCARLRDPQPSRRTRSAHDQAGGHSYHFSRVSCIVRKADRLGKTVTAKVWFQIFSQCLRQWQFRSQYINSNPTCFFQTRYRNVSDISSV